jgi:aspartyl-tRNA(Asn)/glutamyl-tRNA(Gln) amidotransferase subunit B
VSDAWLTELKAQVGELPANRRARYIGALGLSEKDAAILTSDRHSGDFFEQLLSAGVEAKRACNLMETLREMSNEKGEKLMDLGINASQVAEVGQLVMAGKIAASKEVTKQILIAVATRPEETAEEVAKDLDLLQSTDTGAVDAAVDAVIAANPKIVADYKGGKQAAIGSLVGQVMKSTKGLNPKLVQERLKAKLA